ncbi:MAG TPA: winged helix-turn-helix transcriptional regulator, partial [Candidatus Bathyarchaeota archaeon]|nr:winged helix-turn-helix transcriptional regulator [Candidatus Bathyarchaeota archaeon]
RHLRLEDREAIEFIASAGGEVFEAELREHFKLPKSTVWRMVKRLKREGLVEVEKVGGQNLIRLVDKTD